MTGTGWGNKKFPCEIQVVMRFFLVLVKNKVLYSYSKLLKCNIQV